MPPCGRDLENKIILFYSVIDSMDQPTFAYYSDKFTELEDNMTLGFFL
jgi:hypothetical protein